MYLTVSDIRRKIKDLPDDALVYIERIEDVYFEKHNWETERLVFQEVNGVPIEYSDILKASSSTASSEQKDKRLIIYAHI